MEETSEGRQLWGKVHQHGGTGGDRQPKPEVPVPAKGPSVTCLWCCSSWLLLGSSWHSAQENASKLWTKCSKRMCQLFSLPSVVASAPLCAGSDSCPSALVSCAPAPPFSFFLTVGKPKARFPGSCWHNPSCKPLSSLSFARALW